MRIESESAPAATGEAGDRFEFRIFRRVLGPRATLLRAVAGAGRFEVSAERYVIVPGRLDANLKLRSGRLELKTLVRTLDGLEQWHPAGVVPLPACGREFEPLLRGLELAAPPARDTFADAQAVATWFEHGTDTPVARLRKRRQNFVLADGQAEIAEVACGAGRLWTLAVESVEPRVVTALVDRLGLTGETNTSYPRLLAYPGPGR